MKESLKNITESILDSNKETSRADVIRLFDFYKQFPLLSNNTNDVQLSHGFALCEQYAADCILDYKRTYSFIKGIYKAIRDLLETNKEEQVRILYAGCGPYAPLLIPILNLLRDDRLQVTFVDINPSSVTVLTSIAEALSLSEFIESIKVDNAITYRHPNKLDIIVTETMYSALTREPQVAITQNLIPQLKKDGVLIPEEIIINIGYSDSKKEPVLECRPEDYTVKGDLLYKPNTGLKELMKIEKEMDYSLNNGDYFFESNWIHLKDIKYFDPNIFLYTELKVYDQERILKAESNITNPLCVGSLTNLKEESSFKLKYKITKDPMWQIEYK